MTAWTCAARYESFAGHASPVLRWQPRDGARAQAVFFPPYGDEMNQTRRMVRLTAEALAAQGVGSCVFDLKGTGDSTADFSQASVGAWLDDCRTIVEPLAQESLPLVFIGCRLGVALAVQTSTLLARPVATLVGWAPLWKGGQQLSGLLRAARMARLARGRGAQNEEGASPDEATGPSPAHGQETQGARVRTNPVEDGTAVVDPKERWARGEAARLAGYPVSARLAEELEALDATAAPQAQRAALFELRALGVEDPAQISEAMKNRVRAWSEQGVRTEATVLAAPSFWNVVDLVDVPELVEATVRAVTAAFGAGPAGGGS